MAKSDSRDGRVRLTRWPLIRLATYVVGLLAAIILATIATRLLVPPAPSPWHELVWVKNLLLPIALFGIYAGLVRLMERRRASEIDLRKGLLTFFAGLLIGSALIGATFLILMKLGMVEVSGGTGLDGLARAMVIPMVTAMGEELLFRVLFFGILEEIAGSLLAVVISAAVFGLAHAANPGANPFAIFALSVELGVMLALAYMLTGNIWIAVGIHAGWNFMQGFVLGAQDSGVRDPYSYVQTTLSGPEILTGGAFGLEGSIVSLGLCVIVSGLLTVLILRKRRWLGLRFRLGSPRVELATA